MSRIDELLQSQREFFDTGITLDVHYRILALERLREAVKEHEKDIAEALKADLGKNELESFMCETGMVLSELSYMLKHIRKFAKRRRVVSPLAQFPSKSYVMPCPYGNTLIMSPWNYPFLLSMDPLIDAIAAGNTAVIKPSAYSPATAQLVEKIVSECFMPEYVAVVTGGRKENSELLNNKFDFVFFTGSQAVGREVLRHTAEHLTPAVLELGGKSPCIVDETANIELAARRIVFGKFINCGQTCVAPDYILCHRSVKEKLVSAITEQIKQQYGENPLNDPNYGRMVSQKHFQRVSGLISKEKTVHGGKCNEESLQIEPTVLDDVSWDDAVMQEEIFGPVLPVLVYDEFEELFSLLSQRQKPLALYIFSESLGNIEAVTSRIRYGGGCVNDTIIHLATSEMGFGGVGESGMGSYHGKTGFDAFSHNKSIVDKKTWLDLPMRYRPYSSFNEKLIRFFLK